jgi:ribosomal protein S18 acetylase RimI-like enzyme
MRVHPDFQGRGFGQTILEALEARARGLGYSILHLETSVLQLAAQKLYRKTALRNADELLSVVSIASILYEKKL